jgi:hypothetical protein
LPPNGPTSATLNSAGDSRARYNSAVRAVGDFKLCNPCSDPYIALLGVAFVLHHTSDILRWSALLDEAYCTYSNSLYLHSMPNDPYIWREEEERFYLDYMLQGIAQGLRPSGTFKGDFWPACATAFGAAGFRIPSLAQLNNKRNGWRTKWSLWVQLKEQSGWGINPDTGVLEASDAAWERALTVFGKDVRWFQTNPMPYPNELTEIFGTVAATGVHAQGGDLSIDPVLIEPRETPIPLDSSSEVLSQSSTSSQKRKAPIDQLTESLLTFLSDSSKRRRTEQSEEVLAIEILQTDSDFQDLEEEDFLQAIDIVNRSAKTFVALQPKWRLKWLQKQLREGH